MKQGSQNNIIPIVLLLKTKAIVSLNKDKETY